MKQSPQAVPHLFRHWPKIAAVIRAKQRVLVFLDFDGTLAAIVSHPDRVRLKPAMRRALRALARQKKVTTFLISGRRRTELRRHANIRGLQHLGLYGWEQNGDEKISSAARVALFRAHVLLRKELAHYPGIWIEPKQSSLSVHLLNAKPAAQRGARSVVRAMVRKLGALQLFENLRDVEVLPLRMPDKGAAVRKAVAKAAPRGALAFFFGDDLSDEPAFTAIRDGISVLVGSRRETLARFRLRNPDEVAVALAKIKEALA